MIINKNRLYYNDIIKRMEYLNKKQMKIDLQFIKIYNRLTTLYKDYPF